MTSLKSVYKSSGLKSAKNVSADNEEDLISNLDGIDKVKPSSKRASTQCHECGKSLSSKGALYKHLIVIHNRLKNYVCEYCGRSFGQSGDLKRHYATHTGEKKFSCVECGKCFTVKSALTVHIRKHTGEKPFECQRCHKRFTISGDLTRHSRIHLDERNYVCIICKRRFGRKEHLATHYVTHSRPKGDSAEFSCKLCPKTFADKAFMRKHYLKHIPSKESSEVSSLAEERIKAAVHSNDYCDSQVTDVENVHNQLDPVATSSIDQTASNAPQSVERFSNIMFENDCDKEHYSGATLEVEKETFNSDAAFNDICWSFPNIFPAARQNVTAPQSLDQLTNEVTHLSSDGNCEPPTAEDPVNKRSWSETSDQNSTLGFHTTSNKASCDLDSICSNNGTDMEKDAKTNDNVLHDNYDGLESLRKVWFGEEQTPNHFKSLGANLGAAKLEEITDITQFKQSESEVPEVGDPDYGTKETPVNHVGTPTTNEFDSFFPYTSRKTKYDKRNSSPKFADSELQTEYDASNRNENKPSHKPKRKRKSSKPLKISLKISKKKSGHTLKNGGKYLDYNENNTDGEYLLEYAKNDELFFDVQENVPFPKKALGSKARSNNREKREIFKAQCEVCGLYFKTASKFRDHQLTHSKIKPHKCDHCDKAYASRGDLNLHIQSHSGVKQHVCDICGNRYLWAKSLKIHMKTHAKERPHECDVCGRAFFLKADLSRHCKSHSGIKPHECEICHKRFLRKEHLKTHSLTHQEKKPNQCRKCGKYFAQRSSFVRHEASCLVESITYQEAGVKDLVKENSIASSVHDVPLPGSLSLGEEFPSFC